MCYLLCYASAYDVDKVEKFFNFKQECEMDTKLILCIQQNIRDMIHIMNNNVNSPNMHVECTISLNTH